MYIVYMADVHRGFVMTVQTLTRPGKHKVKRSELRQNQSATLRLARGRNVVVISATHEEDEKLLVDKKYFDELIEKLRSVVETLEITSDQKFFKQILSAAENLDENARLGKLHSFEEAFEEG
jgi:hypothetical protein